MPFVKWAGGKRQLLPKLIEAMPREYGHYFEPFVGAGALFFGLVPKRAVLVDANEELMTTYRVVRDNVDALIEALGQHRYEKEYFYEVRSQNLADLSQVELAARMIFLNRTGFNGLYRVNKKGEFNVPFGRHKNPTICQAERLRNCSRVLREADLRDGDFSQIERRTSPGDFVYFDPPYIPLSRSASFTAYQRNGFGMDNQERLAALFDALAARGVFVMLSNSDVPWVRERYAGHKVKEVSAVRAVNRNSAGRGPVGELIVTNY